MKRAWLIASKDMRIYFGTPLAYVIMGLFYLLMTFFYNAFLSKYFQFNMSNPGSVGLNRFIEGFYNNMHVFLMFVIPGLTMRAFSQEKRDHTLELLVTSPIRVWQLVLGKFLGVASVIGALLVSTMLFPAYLVIFGNPDVNVVLSTYLGLFLAGLAYASIGIFASSLTSNQFLSFLASFLIVISNWILVYISGQFEGQWSTLLKKLSFVTYFEDFSKGMVSSASLVFFFSFFFFWLFLTYRNIDSQSWRS